MTVKKMVEAIQLPFPRRIELLKVPLKSYQVKLSREIKPECVDFINGVITDPEPHMNVAEITYWYEAPDET